MLRFLLAVLVCGALTTAVAPAQGVEVEVRPGATPSTLVFPTIQMAIDHAPPAGEGGRLVIRIAPGVYNERVWVPRRRGPTTLLGGGKEPGAVVITGSRNGPASGGTFFSEITEVDADDFQADDVTFANTAGPTGQALAITVSSDRAIFKHCRFLGFQDTLFADYGRQYYVDSFIEGAVDFIFGNATAVFDRDEIHVTRAGYVTAQSRTAASETTGYVVTHSRVTSDDLLGGSFYLGRPWRAFSRVVVMHTELPAELSAAGWAEWKSNAADLTKVFYAEYANTGPGTAAGPRASWTHMLTAGEAEAYEPSRFLRGSDGWDAVAEASKLP